MATDPFEQEEGGNPFARALRNGLVLAPIGLAGYTGYQRVAANSALNPVAAARATLGPGRLGSTGREVGQALQKSAVDSKQRLLQHADDEIANLLKEDGIQKLFQSVEQQRAVIQSLLDTMDDPSSGLPDEFLLSYKERLLDIAQRSLDGPDAQETVASVVKAMSDGGSLTKDARARWASNLREYQKIAPYLTPPNMPLNANKVFQPIHLQDLKNKGGMAYKRYQQLAGGLGQDGSRYINLVGYGDQVYARVYSAGGASTQGAFLGSVPLSLGKTQPGGYVSMRMNEGLTTGYRANKYIIDAQAANNLLTKNSSLSVSGLKTGGAIMDIEDYHLREFLNRAQTSSRGLYLTGGRNSFGAWQRQQLAADARLVSSGQPFSGAAGMASHIQAAASFQHNFATVANFGRMRKEEQQALLQKLVGVGGFESGVGAGRILSRGLNNEMFGTIGIYQGSALEALQSTALTNIRSTGENLLEQRGLFPSTSRIEQVPGRESAFVGSGRVSTMGRGGVFSAGATFGTMGNGDITRTGSNIEWANSVTGGTNKAIILDVSETGKLYRALEGTGAAYHMGRERVRHAFTKPILDPGSQGSMGSAFFNELTNRVEEGKLTYFSRKELKEFGNFLGIGPSGMQYLRDDPRMLGARIGYKVTEQGGKKHVNIIGEIERELETFKGFSLMHKGTLQEISAGTQADLIGSDTLRTLEGLGISEKHRVYAAGDMLKKGAGFFDLQMTSAYGMVTGDKNFRQTLAGLSTTQQFSYLGDSHLARVTGAVIRGLGRHQNVSAQEAGLVLGAIYNRGEDWIGGLNASQQVSREGITRAISEAFGDRAQDVIKAASKGQALAATTYTLGAGVGDYGLGRGSAEPRFFSNLQHRLRRMGLSQTQTSDFIAGIYRNKIGYAEHLTSASGIMKLAESVAGVRGSGDAMAALAAGTPSYGLSDIPELATKIKSDGLTSFMAQKGHSGGFMLDLTKGANTPALRALASNAQDVFGQGQIFIPGTDVMNAMRGTQIKTTTGNISIQDEYSRMITNFMDDLATVSSATDRAKSSTNELQAFKATAMDMAGKVIHQVAGGKIRGLQSQVAAIYDLTEMTGFSSMAKAQVTKDIFKKTKGMSVFMDTKGFLSQLGDFMGGTLTTEDAARKAEMFFTSLEGNNPVHSAKGIVGVASRHPLLSLGNVAPTQIFRHIEETGMGAADEAFASFIGTDLGKQYANMKGFKDVSSRNQAFRTKFFKDFVSSIDQISGTGGGRVFLPRMMADVQYGGGSLSVDMGISGAAIGDWDGDQWQMLMVNEDSGKSIMSTLKSSKEREAWLTADNIYKIKSEIFTAEAKAGLKAHNIGTDIGFADVRRLQQDLMKESASKDLVGSLDVRLNKLRTAVMDMAGAGNAAQAEEAMALLKVVQEHSVIKGKKLPVFKPFAEMLNTSIDDMFAGAGSGSLRRVMAEEIFPGSALTTAGGLRVTGGSAGIAAGQEAINSMAGGMMRLDDTMDFIDQAVARARTTGISDYPSQARLAMGMGSKISSEAEHAFNVIRSSMTTQGGIISGFEGNTFKNIAATAENAMSGIRAAAQRMDRKTMGLAAMGGIAALGLGALVSNEGYSASPIAGPMELGSSAVNNAAAAGSLLQPRSTGPRPEQFQTQTNPYAIHDRPVNIGSTYVNNPTSYQVRGEIYNDTGIGAIGNYMSTIGGNNVSGSVRINDARRPITQNYLDRLTGEY